MSHDDFPQKLERVERAVAEVERLARGEVLEATRTLVRALLDVHKDALHELFTAGEGPSDALVALACRPRIAWLLGLHGINPDPLEGRAREAVRTARSVAPPGARAEIVSIEEEAVKVRVLGAAEDSRRLLARAVERSMAELAPEAEVTFEGVAAEPRDSDLVAPERLVRREVRSS